MVVWYYLHAFRPLASRSVGAQQDEKHRDCHDEDTGDNERDSPSKMWSKSLLGNKRVVDGRHRKVRYASTSIAEACSYAVRSANDVLVEKSRRPDLAWHEATAKNADEESQRV